MAAEAENRKKLISILQRKRMGRSAASVTLKLSAGHVVRPSGPRSVGRPFITALRSRLFHPAVAPLFFFCATVPLFAQQPQLSREQLIKAAREIMTSASYCALITSDSRGAVNARTMDAFAPEADMTVWF